ncbi:MAG TPA: amino acid adenylation protein, partial [Verrucomicrobiae bacterium]|nr:amino acid adenylation protein [Verrucomicrobiae bacterium]
GGDSLHAAELVSLLRDDPLTAEAAVRDLYEARSVAGLAERLRASAEPQRPAAEGSALRGGGSPMLCGIIQGGWLLLGLLAGSAAAWVAAFQVMPRLVGLLGVTWSILLSPLLFLLSLTLYTPLSVLQAALLKRVLIGRYVPLDAPVWGSFYLRNWMVQQAVRLVPWGLLEGTVFQLSALRLLGARIGRRVHIQRGVDLRHGGWDLLEIGDDVSIGQDAVLRLVDYDAGRVLVGGITLGDGCTVETRAGIGGGCVMEAGSFLTAHSSLQEGERVPRGERWDGVPARRAGSAPLPPEPTRGSALSPLAFSLLLVLARSGRALLLMLPLELLLAAGAAAAGTGREGALQWLASPSTGAGVAAATALITAASVPLTLGLEALLLRRLGPVRPGVIPRWSAEYVRVWLKTQTVNSASELLSGTLFWPHWLRLAGMAVGRGCEISRVIDVVPELVSIGDESFFADGIYLGSPKVHRGTVTLCRTILGPNTFLGNHSVISCGAQLPEDILIGISTVADDSLVRPGTSWFGHPPFELPRREVVEYDRRFTHDPPPLRYWSRVAWELLRSAIPVPPALALLVWYEVVAAAAAALPAPLFLLAALPAANLALGGGLCLLVLALKWLLLGRVRPGIHPLWSCWCSRWDFLFVVWRIYARRQLSALEGTPFLSWYLRGTGMRIGRGTVLAGRYAQVVDPDMLEFGEGATVACQF